MEDKEKANEQLSGRVTDSQKNYFNNEMEGSFSEKLGRLIETYEKNKKYSIFNTEANKDAIKQALNVIVKNIETIELNAKNYVQNINDDIGTRISELEENANELNNALSENKELKESNQDLSVKIDKLANEYRDITDELTSERLNSTIKYDNLKKEYEELNQDYMKSRLELGDIKEKLTDENIALTEKVNKLKEEHNQEISKLKEDHAAELAKLNKESVEKINAMASNYTALKVKTDETISELDKDLAVAKSTIDSKNDLINRLEKEIAALEKNTKEDRDWINNTLGPMAKKYIEKSKELEKILEDNGIKVEKDK